MNRCHTTGQAAARSHFGPWRVQVPPTKGRKASRAERVLQRRQLLAILERKRAHPAVAAQLLEHARPASGRSYPRTPPGSTA